MRQELPDEGYQYPWIWDPALEAFRLNDTAEVWWLEGSNPTVLEGRFILPPKDEDR